MKSKAFRSAFPHTLPVMAGYLFLGMGFGILLESNGYSFIWAFFMSIFIYAGSMQYVAIDLLASGASLISTAIMTLMIQVRHLFYGLSIIDKYKDTGKKKLLLIHELTDETYSLLCSVKTPEGIDAGDMRFWIAMLDHSYWILGSVLGTIIGGILPFDTTGIDFAMTSLFTVIFVEQWQSTKCHIPALMGLAAAAVSLAILGPDNFILPAMLAICVMLVAMRGRLAKEVA
mgnify:CR=1 FL=1